METCFVYRCTVWPPFINVCATCYSIQLKHLVEASKCRTLSVIAVQTVRCFLCRERLMIWVESLLLIVWIGSGQNLTWVCIILRELCSHENCKSSFVADLLTSAVAWLILKLLFKILSSEFLRPLLFLLSLEKQRILRNLENFSPS